MKRIAAVLLAILLAAALPAALAAVEDGFGYVDKFTLEDGTDATLATVFPDFPDRVFAHWYSGTIRIPQGKQLQYVHMGYGSTFERDLFLEIERGVIVATRVRHNGTAQFDDAPEGYKVGAMTVWPRTGKDEGESA